MFSDIRNIAVNDSGRVLFVADWNKGLIAVKEETGRRMWWYTEDDLVNATGVCVDEIGGVFVCGYNSHNVLQFNESGQKIGEIVTRTCGIARPCSVCFVRGSSTLVVTQWGNNAFMQYQLTT